MIQTTEVWVLSCDKCHKPYGRPFPSKYQLLTEAARLGGWTIKDPHAICKDCNEKDQSKDF
jgi:hypothetical protein